MVVDADLDRTDLLIYEEVARMPPFQRKCLVLLGAKGVGRRTLKQMLIKADPKRFASVVPCKTFHVCSFLDYHCVLFFRVLQFQETTFL